jgi:hypothetical protein
MIRTSLSFTTRAGKSQVTIDANPASRLTGARAGGAPGGRSRQRSCDYDAPAALFVREASRLRYQAFDNVALAIQHANENLTERQLNSCTMDVDDVRFVGDDVRRLYLAAEYPLPRAGEAA